MAVRFSAGGHSLSATASLPSITGFTIMGWVSRSVSGFQYVFTFGSSTGGAAYALIFDGSDHPAIENGLGNATDAAVTVGTAQWDHFALVVRGTGAGQVEGYINGVLDASLTFNGNAAVAAEKLWIGSNFYDVSLNGRVAWVKIWDAALSAGEIAQEFRIGRPVRFANLWGFYPIFPGSGERGRDYSGFAHTLTENGSLTDEDPPPVSYGSNAGWEVFKANLTPTQNLLPTGIAGAEAFGTSGLGMVMFPGGITSGEAAGQAHALALSLALSGIASGEAMGTLTLSETMTFSGIGTQEILGAPTLSFIMYLDGMATQEAFGQFILTNQGELVLPGIATLEAFGSLGVAPGPVILLPSGIATAEAIGPMLLSFLLAPPGIASAELAGSPSLAVGPAFILPGGVVSGEAFGTAAFTLLNNVTLVGIPSDEGLGTPAMGVFMRLSGVPSAEAFGTMILAGVFYMSDVGGIASAEAFGIPGSGADSAIARELGTYVEYTFRKVEVPA